MILGSSASGLGSFASRVSFNSFEGKNTCFDRCDVMWCKIINETKQGHISKGCCLVVFLAAVLQSGLDKPVKPHFSVTKLLVSRSLITPQRRGNK